MPHVLIVGLTGSGKTTLAMLMAQRYKELGIGTVVLDPLMDGRWRPCADFISDSPHKFMRVVKASRSCAIFLDESGETVGRYNDELFWLATRARHYGHNTHFITQRANQLNPTVRDQCEYLFAFSVSFRDAKMLANDWASDLLLQTTAMRPGLCMMKSRFSQPVVLDVFSNKRKVIPIKWSA